MTAADQPTTEPSAEQVYQAWYGSDEPWGGCADREAVERTLALLTPVLQPAADTEPVQRATKLLVQHQATSASGCICGGVPLGRSHPEHAARVLDDVGLLPSTRDSRIDAWHRVAEHPVFASSCHEGVPLIESVLRRLDEVAGLDTPAPAGG